MVWLCIEIVYSLHIIVSCHCALSLFVDVSLQYVEESLEVIVSFLKLDISDVKISRIKKLISIFYSTFIPLENLFPKFAKMTSIQYVSDIHLECMSKIIDYKTIITPIDDDRSGYIILAGDIGRVFYITKNTNHYEGFIHYCALHWNKVFFILGNRKFNIYIIYNSK